MYRRINLGQGLPSSYGLLFFSLRLVVQGLLLLGGHMDHKVHHPVAFAKSIVIQRKELEELAIEGNASHQHRRWKSAYDC